MEKLNPSFDSKEEKLHFCRILNSYLNYKSHAMKRLKKSLNYFETLSDDHKSRLERYRKHLDDVRECINTNDELIQKICDDVCTMFENVDYTKDVDLLSDAAKPSMMDMDKVQSVLKQIVREWSEEGNQERNASFRPILDEISERFKHKSGDERGNIKILVPGAGLGRLPHEIACLGFSCQANEYSLFMLFASQFILNKCKGSDLFTIHPWSNQYHNNVNAVDQLKSVQFPDIDPSSLPFSSDFSMAAGDFVQIYQEPEEWDALVTCFFVDTAKNILSYLETIYKILKPGGYWINLGPLLYHYADLPDEGCIEPSYDILRDVILETGFVILKEKIGIRSSYTQNPRSMLSYKYKSVYFVCQKR